MKTFLIFLTAFILTIPAAHADKVVHKDLVLDVNGMVCDFCAQSVLKVFEDYEAVESVDVSLERAEVIVHLKPGMDLPDSDIEKAITYAGYSLVGINRAPHEG